MGDGTLNFDLAWLSGASADPVERSTFAALTITAGPDRLPITEVDDALARTVRPSIYVPVAPLAGWLIANWWRLRWEPRSDSSSPGWLQAHSLAAVSPDVAWPALLITSDGDFIQLEARAERIRDVAAVRYIRDVDVSIAGLDFERAVDGLLAQVDARIASCHPEARVLADLLAELREERSDPQLARACKLQALAGIDPGLAPDGWLREAESIVSVAGEASGAEVVAAIPELSQGIHSAQQAIASMQRAPTSISLGGWASAAAALPGELPWQRGRRLAQAYRVANDAGDDRVANEWLGARLDVRLPMPLTPGATERGLRGGFRSLGGRTSVLVTSGHLQQQRFYLGRLIAASMIAADEESVLPVTNAATAYQKFERSFAQELLCPWAALDAYTDEYGTDDEGVAAAAAHFEVSEYLVLSALVNNHKVGRHRLPSSGRLQA